MNDYLVGAQLDEALSAGQDILVSWPFADGDVRDWVQAEAIWCVVFEINTRPVFNVIIGNTYCLKNSRDDAPKMSPP